MKNGKKTTLKSYMLSARYLASIEGEYACAEFEENFMPKKFRRKHMKRMKHIKNGLDISQ